jgi:AraC-like DNA-binding protein
VSGHERTNSGRSVTVSGTTRVAFYRHTPEALRPFGVEFGAVLEAAAIPPETFAFPDNEIEYTQVERLLAACEALTHCDHIGMLLAQRTRLADFGLVGQLAMCGATAGDGLRTLIDNFNLLSNASSVSLAASGGFARFVYAITFAAITRRRQFQLGAVTIMFNALQDLFGPQWQPSVLTFACRAPSSLRPLQQHFQAPMHFNADESAVVFEDRWLHRVLPPVDPEHRGRLQVEARRRQAAIRADLPSAVRGILHKQFVLGRTQMDEIAAIFGVHRRTLDRQLQEHGVRYSELLVSVKEEIARQLLLETDMQVQQIAEALNSSSAANFATSFRRWTGMSPSEFRRRSRRPEA